MLGKIALILSLSAGAILDSRAASSDVGTNVEDEVRFLREQNRLLQQQVQEQGGELNTLAQKVRDLETAKPAGESEGAAASGAEPAKSGFSFGRVDLDAEGGLAYFNTAWFLSPGTWLTNPCASFSPRKSGPVWPNLSDWRNFAKFSKP